MKLRPIILIIALFAVIMAMSGTVWAGENRQITITGTYADRSTDPAHPATFLIDNDPDTYWTVKPGSDQAWVELTLNQPALIHGLQLSGSLGSDVRLTVEYQQNGYWSQFLGGSLQTIPVRGIIDLSYDRIVTGRLRIRLTGTDVAVARLNDVKVISEAVDYVLHRINPVSVNASGHTSHLTRAEFLTDGNTYTYWMVKPRYRSGNNWLFETIEKYLGNEIDYNYNYNWPNRPSYYNYGEVLFDLDRTQTITNVNIFFTEDTRGDLTVEAQINGAWQKTGFISERRQPGWYRLPLNNINTSKIRLVMEATGHDSVGGISEVEFWGYGDYRGHSHLEIGPQTPQSLGKAINRSFKLRKDEAKDYNLQFALSESGSEQTIAVELNGEEYSAYKITAINGHAIFSLPLSEAMLDNEGNYLRIKPLSGSLTGLKLTYTGDGAQPHQSGALNDGLLLSSGSDAAEQIVELKEKILVEQVEIYAAGAAGLALYYKEGANWIAVDPLIVTPGCVRYQTPLTAKQFKIANSSRLYINEARILGSPVTDRAPMVRLIHPIDYEVFDCDQLSDKYLVGFVDNPRATVKVNGKDVFQIGHYFGFHLTAIGANTWEDTIVTAVATDPKGRTGRYETHIIIDKLPWMTIDQTANTVITANTIYQISGELKKTHSVVKVNGQTVTEQKGKFITQVALVEGLNLLKIECVYNKQGNSGGNSKKEGFTQTFYRKVICHSGGLELQVTSPLDGSRIDSQSVVVSGNVYGYGEIKVLVNGKTATVSGERFSAMVTLAEGKNTINVTAKNTLGVSANAGLTVWRDTAPPILNITKPLNQSYSKTAMVTVAGTVTDVSPVYVLINGAAAELNGNQFTATLTLSENWNNIEIQAVDAAGNVTEKTLKVMVDTMAPLPFTPTSDLPGWTNNNRPVINFGTTDAGSGVNHYEIRIGSGTWIKPVASPYQFANPLPDGELIVQVKAVDKTGNERIGEVKLYIDTTPPESPEIFRVIPGNTRMIIKWSVESPDTVEFRVERDTGGIVTQISIPTPEYTDSGLNNGTLYKYRVRAIDRAGNESRPTEWKEGLVGLASVPYDDKGAIVEYEDVVLVMPDTGLPDGVAKIEVTEVISEHLREKAIFPIISPIYEFSAYKHGEAAPLEVVTMERGYLGKINYDISKIPQGFPEHNLAVYYYDPMFDRWFQVKAAGVDPKTHSIYFFTNHFSSFTVQANVIQDLSPQEVKDAGYSPLRSYSEHGGVNVSPQGGTVSTQVTELILPGKNGFDLVISRHYDTAAARSDAFAVAVSAKTGFNLIDVDQGDFKQVEEIKELIDNWEKFQEWNSDLFFKNVRSYVEKYLFNQGDYACSMGQGWRLNLPYIRNANDTVILVTADGTMHSINEMEIIGAPSSQFGYRSVEFRQREGEDFTLLIQQANGNVDFTSIISGDTMFKPRWYGLGYRLTMRDGTVYEMDQWGRTTAIIDPTGLNVIRVNYDGFKIDYIEDTMGRKVCFDYKNGILSHRIKKIWVENDPYKREINYTIDDTQLLQKARDVGGRVSSYGYDMRLMYYAESGITVHIANIVIKLLAKAAGPQGDAIIKILEELFEAPQDVELYTNIQAQLVFPMDEMEASGKGLVKIDYDQYTFTYFKCDIDWYASFPVEFNFSLNVEQRLYAVLLDLYPGRNLPPIRTIRYDYEIEDGLFDQPYTTKAEENDGNRKTIYHFSEVEKMRHHWGDQYATLGQDKGISFWFPVRTSGLVKLPVNTEIEIRDIRNGKDQLLERHTTRYNETTMRPTQKTTWHGSNYRRQAFDYDDWGNLIFSDEYSVSNQRINQLKTWMYYHGTGSVPSPDAPWLGSPFGKINLERERYDLMLGMVMANYIPAADGGTTVQYIHSYHNYNELGQQTESARWNGNEWLYTGYYYHPEHGSLVRKVNPEGHETWYEYDQYGYPAAVIEKSVKDASGATEDLIIRTGYEYISGWKRWEKNPRGYVTEYEYDVLGRVTKITAPDDDDPVDWIPESGQPAFRTKNPITTIDYNDSELTSLVTDPLGRHTLYDFDTLGQLVKIEKDRRDRNGKYIEPVVTTIHYDSWGNIFKIVDPNGYTGSSEPHTTRYEYDALGRNTAIIYPDETAGLDDNPRKEMLFDYNTNTLTIINERLDKTVEEHDMQGRVIRRLQYNGEEVIESKTYYDGLGNEVITIAPPKAGMTVKTYNALNLLEKIELPAEKVWENNQERTVTPYQRYEYNKVGVKIAEFISTAAGEQVVVFDLDELGRTIRSTTSYSDNGEIKKVINEVYYDPNGNKVKVVDANNTLLPKENQKAFNYKYSATDLLLEEIDPAGNKTIYTYDPVGNRTGMTDPRGACGKYAGDFSIIYVYDDLNRLIEGHLPAAPDETVKPVVKLRYDSRGNLLEREEPDGGKTNYTYYPRNLVKTVTTSGSGKNYSITYKYDNLGNQTEIHDSRGYVTIREYDALQRVTKVIYPEFNTEIYSYDTNNNRMTFTNGLQYTTESSYDRYNRLIEVKDAKGGSTVYNYDRLGNLTRMINALGHVTEYQYDELNRLILEKSPERYQTKYRYDPVGNRIWSQDPNGAISEYRYYPNNLLQQVALSNGFSKQILEYQYDEAGYRKQASNGVVITKYNNFDGEYVPDPFGRVRRESKSFDGRTFSVDYRYDVMGRVTGVKYPSGQWVNYHFNTLGQLTKVPGYIEEAPIYDNGGMLQSMKAANGIVTSFDFDKNGRLKQLSYNNQDSIIKRYNYQYDAANNIRFKNEDEFRYDQLNQLIFAGLKGQFEADTQIEEQQVGRIVKDFKGQLPLEFQINQLDVIELDYAAGSIGVDLQNPAAITRIQLTPQSPVHRVTETDSLGVFISDDNSTYTPVANWSLKTGADGVLEIVLSTPVTARYLKIKSYYDNRNLQFGFVNKAEFVNTARELIKVYYQVDYRQEDYTYDAIGNRKTETVTQGNAVTRFYEYYPNSSRLMSNEKYNFVYDNNGNLVKKTAIDGSVTWEYQYDLLNRLESVTKNGVQVASYLYDESGLRLKKQGNDKAVYYIFDTGGNVLYEQENREYLEYVYVLGKHFARVDGNLDNSIRKKYFYHTDHLGSTVAVTDEAGQTVWTSEYTPFGGRHSVAGEMAKAAKFTGKDLDEDIGLYYFNARWYDQEIGRFISEDPIKDGLNWYTYAVNNPLRYIDPSGLAYEDFEREAQTSSIWGDLISRVKNYYAGHGPITDSELRIRERNKLSEGIGKDPTATSAQASLVIMGYDLGASGPRKDGVDGDPGKKTEKAVMEFQQAVGLSPTGIIDAQTTAALDLAIRAGFKKADLEKIGETYKHYNLDWPTQSRNITSPFGTRIHPISKKERFHAGIDIGAVTAGVEGDRIVSAADGRVVLSANQPDGAGYYLVIESIYKGQKTQILYMHLQEGSIVVKQDDIVRAGQHIANMGNTGTSTAAHLHFEIRVFEGGEWVRKDPMSWNYNY